MRWSQERVCRRTRMARKLSDRLARLSDRIDQAGSVVYRCANGGWRLSHIAPTCSAAKSTKAAARLATPAVDRERTEATMPHTEEAPMSAVRTTSVVVKGALTMRAMLRRNSPIASIINNQNRETENAADAA